MDVKNTTIIFIKGNIFCCIVFSSLDSKALPKWNQLLKERICSSFLSVVPIRKDAKLKMEELLPLKVPIHHKLFLPMRQGLMDKNIWNIFSGAGKFCLAHGLRQLTLDTICDISYLQTLLKRHKEKLQMTFGVGHCTMLIVNILFNTSIFPIIGKKNNQSSGCDPDREIPTRGSTDNARNSVKSCF